VIQRELPVDILEFFYLTPLPGSEDHKHLWEKGVEMDPDLNKYDLNHAVTGHPLMSKEVWEEVYRKAWDTYYSDEHVERVLRRAGATGNSIGKTLFILNWFIGSIRIEHMHPLECGFVRRKFRRDRRSGMPIEPAWRFYPRHVSETLAKQVRWLWLWGRMYRLYRSIKRNPNRSAYMDEALTPVADDDSDKLDLFQSGEAKAYVAQERRLQKIRAGAA
jgi:hypothetical protein